jgi:hypothetical protein
VFRKGKEPPIERNDMNLVLEALMRLDAKLEEVLQLLREEGGDGEADS